MSLPSVIKYLLKKIRRCLPLRVKHVEPLDCVDLGVQSAMPDGFQATNPSLLALPDGYLVCIRGVNYIFGDDMRSTTFKVGNSYRSCNRFYVLDQEFQVRYALPKLDYLFDNIEDVKLFTVGQSIMGIGSCSSGANASIALLTINPDLQDGRLQMLKSPFGLRQEKNWAPFSRSNTLYFVYSFEPLIILHFQKATGQVVLTDPAYTRYREQDLKFLLGGSSAGVPEGDGFLFVVHRRKVSLVGLKRSYVNRIYYLSNDLTLRAGPYFSIGRKTVQFVNGMVRDGDYFIMSYGLQDRNAYICRIPIEKILPQI